jgi:hypothetical protein
MMLGFLGFLSFLVLASDGHAHVAQLVERILGKDEVISSILIMGSSLGRRATNTLLN